MNENDSMRKLNVKAPDLRQPCELKGERKKNIGRQ